MDIRNNNECDEFDNEMSSFTTMGQATEKENKKVWHKNTFVKKIDFKYVIGEAMDQSKAINGAKIRI